MGKALIILRLSCYWKLPKLNPSKKTLKWSRNSNLVQHAETLQREDQGGLIIS